MTTGINTLLLCLGVLKYQPRFDVVLVCVVFSRKVHTYHDVLQPILINWIADFFSCLYISVIF